MGVKIYYSCTCDTGRLRSINQDNFTCAGECRDVNLNESVSRCNGMIEEESQAVFGVFDGLGGEEHGELASWIAARTAGQWDISDDVEKSLAEYCDIVNKMICRYADDHFIDAMGTTAAMLVFRKGKYYVCNIGDSRVYRVEEDKLQQISLDHIFTGTKYRKAPLSQKLGQKEGEGIIEPYEASGRCGAEDCFLICSDGLTDMLPEDEIAEVLCTFDIETVADELVRRALEAGGRDNVTALVLLVRRSGLSRLREIF